jgi:high-affinity iron transporter
VGFRLPMKRLFTLSTLFLFGTAVVLLGKGLHALQEVGALPIRPVAFVRLDLLGVYPDLYTLFAQAALLLGAAGYLLLRRGRGKTPGAQGTSS